MARCGSGNGELQLPMGLGFRAAAVGFHRQEQLLLELAAVAANPKAACNLPHLSQAQLTQVFRGKSGSRHGVRVAKVGPSSSTAPL